MTAPAAAGASIDPVVAAPFRIGAGDKVATLGSCFAQHLSRMLAQDGFTFLVTERFTGAPGTTDDGYGVFPARFGNLYTARQLLQLFDRAYGLFRPRDRWWKGRGGGVIDPFRSRIQAGGFDSVEALEADRVRHLAAVRKMFEACDVLVFTFGLTEYWAAAGDGAVFPLAPGAASPEPPERPYRFGNFSVAEVVRDVEAFLDRFLSVNRSARILLTVSPVPLVATHEDRHVLVSTVASKSILRAAVEEVCRAHPEIGYFPLLRDRHRPPGGRPVLRPQPAAGDAGGRRPCPGDLPPPLLRRGDRRRHPGGRRGATDGRAAAGTSGPAPPARCRDRRPPVSARARRARRPLRRARRRDLRRGGHRPRPRGRRLIRSAVIADS